MLFLIIRALISVLQTQRALAVENLALRHQLLVLQRPARKPRLRATDRALWGSPRIHGELRELGIEISQAAVSKYMVRHRKPPSQNWCTFLENHAKDIVSIDFFTVPTLSFRVLFSAEPMVGGLHHRYFRRAA